jgi:hypothetical protein
MDTLARAKWIEARADEALRKTGQSSPPTDLRAIAAHFGLGVAQGKRDEGVIAHFDAVRGQIILGEHDRWPFAHELGHALLSHGAVNCFDGGVSGDMPLEDADVGVPFEAEANRFARHLLVPKRWLKDAIAEGGTAAALAGRFAVSEQVIWRAILGYKLRL